MPRRPLARALAAALALGVVPAVLPVAALVAQTARPAAGRATPRPVGSPATAPTGGYDTTAFAALRWREIGPFRGGRSVAAAGSAARPLEYWMGTTGGGVFKTTDGGMSWQPMTDKHFGGPIGYIAVAESNPDVVYVGTGEYAIRGNVTHGEGVWKTTDGGKTWRFLGLKETRQISRVRVHPTNPDIVYVAAQGAFWGPSRERGIYKSTDGGQTWAQILFRDEKTGASDLVLDPTNPDIMYAAFWESYRNSWSMSSGGPGSTIMKSTDGGKSWTEIGKNPGLPKGLLGNIGLAVSPANPRRLWALLEADSGGVFRSDDGGATWTKTNEERKLRQRAWYYSRVFADPKDTNVVYALNTSLYRSADGGKTFRPIPTPHGDDHDLWIAPNDPQRMIEANDGGANVSFNGGKAWTNQQFATAQFYHVTTTNHFPYQVCGAQQDNSTLCGPSRAPGGISMSMWTDAGGGESGYIAIDPKNPDVSYAGSYGGLLERTDMRTGRSQQVNPWPDNPMGISSKDITYRFQWTFPIVFSPHDPTVLYAGGNHVFRSTNGGQSWDIISPDLTRKDPKTMQASGGPITKDQTGVETYATIFALAESPVAKGVMWAGSDDGLVHLTRDGGKTWTNVTPPDLGDFTRVSIIDPSPHAAGTAYLAANRYGLGDLRPILYKTADYGKTWTRIVNGIPAEEFTRAIREDPARRGLLYAATERGVWASFDDGAHWQSLKLNLPPVPVHDLAIKEGDLIAGTHGRSFWILDDLSALRQLTPDVAKAPVHLYKPRDTYRVSWGGGFSEGRSGPTGKNPPSGAILYYTLAKPNTDLTLEILDQKGTVLRTFRSALDSAGIADSVRVDSLRKARGTSTGGSNMTDEQPADFEAVMRSGPRPARLPNKAGLNTFAWDLRHPDAVRFEGMILWAGGTTGPIVAPGTYTARLVAAGQPAQVQTFRILPDPRATAKPAEYAAQEAFALKIRDRLSEANNAVRTIRNVKWQLGTRAEQVPGAERAAFDAQRRTLAEALSAAEEEIYQVRNQSGQDPLNYPIKLNNKIAALSGVVASAEGRPTRQSYAVFDSLSRKLQVQLDAMQQALKQHLPPVNATLTKVGLPPIVPSTAEPPRGRAAAPRIAAEEEETEQKRW